MIGYPEGCDEDEEAGVEVRFGEAGESRVGPRRRVALAWGGRGRRREPLADDRRERGARDDGRGGARPIDRACQGNRPEIGLS